MTYKEELKLIFDNMFTEWEIDILELLNKWKDYLRELNLNNSNYDERQWEKSIKKYIEELFNNKNSELIVGNFENRIIVKNFYRDFLQWDSYSSIFNRFYKIIWDLKIALDKSVLSLNDFYIEWDLTLVWTTKIIFLQKGIITNKLNILALFVLP